MYNDRKTRNEGQTLCTMIRRQRTKDKQYVQWSEDKERRRNNMYNDQKTKNEGQTICTMIRRQRTKERQYVQWSEDKERRTDNMYNDQKTKNEGSKIIINGLVFSPVNSNDPGSVYMVLNSLQTKLTGPLATYHDGYIRYQCQLILFKLHTKLSHPTNIHQVK